MLHFFKTKFVLQLDHTHQKRKDSLDRALLAAELEFSKILIPRLSQDTSDVNIGSCRESE